MKYHKNKDINRLLKNIIFRLMTSFFLIFLISDYYEDRTHLKLRHYLILNNCVYLLEIRKITFIFIYFIKKRIFILVFNNLDVLASKYDHLINFLFRK